MRDVFEPQSDQLSQAAVRLVRRRHRLPDFLNVLLNFQLVQSLDFQTFLPLLHLHAFDPLQAVDLVGNPVLSVLRVDAVAL